MRSIGRCRRPDDREAKMRRHFSLSLLIALAGCASVGTFVNETGDLTSGRTAQSVAGAQQRQNQAMAENAALHNQLAGLQAQKATLHSQLTAAQAQLRSVNNKLAKASSATQEQRDEYQRLLDKQRDLQRRLAAASAAPPPADPAAAAAQKAQLDQLAGEKDVLEQQVNALQRAL